MRGIYTPLTKIRRQVFEEIARLAFSGHDARFIEYLPFEIIKGEIAQYRDSVFKERAIVSERLRLAMGLPLRDSSLPIPITFGMDDPTLDSKVYEMPFINVIPFACNACEEKAYAVTDNCRGCLAHPCTAVCPFNAVSIVNGKSVIDKEKCYKCGRCKDACPYSAIVQYDRPCAAACGVDDIESDEYGRAKINTDKCVACGQCMVSCPFGAIADKSQVWQLAKALMGEDEVIAEVAPSFVGQFGPAATPQKVKAALLELGFSRVYEVAAGADVGTVEEAHHYAEKVATGEDPFLATSCCPSWSVMAKHAFPEIEEYMSKALTPMVATARLIKEKHPNARVAFIGPCASKKLEAMRRSVRSDVEFVVTYEEMIGMLLAKDIEVGLMEDIEMADASAGGRGYGAAGGVADAIAQAVAELHPGVEVKIDRAEGLANCRKMLALAKAGKRQGYLLEGMSCPGGCIAGPGTVIPTNKAAAELQKFQKAAPAPNSAQSPALEEFGK